VPRWLREIRLIEFLGAKLQARIWLEPDVWSRAVIRRE